MTCDRETFVGIAAMFEFFGVLASLFYYADACMDTQRMTGLDLPMADAVRERRRAAQYVFAALICSWAVLPILTIICAITVTSAFVVTLIRDAFGQEVK